MGDCNTFRRVKRCLKDHICCHCGVIIPKGSSYSMDTGIFDNEPYTMKQHHECKKVYIAFNGDAGPFEWFELHNMDNFNEHVAKMRKIYE